jgi:hypothetical protein
VSEGFYFTSGMPISVLGPEIYNGYGDGTINLDDRGSNGRVENSWALDLHADYELPFLRTANRGLSLILDVFNVTNNKAVVEVDQDYYYEAMPGGFELWDSDPTSIDDFGNPVIHPDLAASPYYGTPTLYQAPRSVQIGVKFTY